MIAKVREIHGDDHQGSVGGILEVAIPGFFEVFPESSHLFFGRPELAGYNRMSVESLGIFIVS